MTVIAQEANLQLEIPESVRSLATFRKWVRSDDFPEDGRICYLGGVWIDRSKEQLFSHNGIKTEFTIVLGGIARTEQTGRYFTDGARLSNAVADLSAVPDGLFISWESLKSGATRLIEGSDTGFVELEGSPDMALEAVSASSVRKDTIDLKERYWKAGVTEYWLVDARNQPPEFTIYRWEPAGYAALPVDDGWVSSAVFGKSFRLVSGADPGGNPEFRLETR